MPGDRAALESTEIAEITFLLGFLSSSQVYLQPAFLKARHYGVSLNLKLYYYEINGETV